MKKKKRNQPDSVPVAVNKNIMMTENNDASWHAWTDSDDDDEDDPEPCQVQLFIAQGRCQTVQQSCCPPCCRQMCIIFSAERRIRLSFSYRFGHVSSCCCRCLINLKLYECCRVANVASIFLQFIRRTRSLTQLPLPVYLPLSLAQSQNVQKVLAQNERISQKPKMKPREIESKSSVKHENWPGLPTKLFFIEPNLVVWNAEQQQQHTLQLTSC